MKHRNRVKEDVRSRYLQENIKMKKEKWETPRKKEIERERYTRT